MNQENQGRFFIMLVLGFLICLIILSGEAYADPTRDAHGIKDHDEITTKMSCSVMYLRLYTEIKFDPGVSTLDKEEVRVRGKGLTLEVIDLYAAAGHTEDEMDDIGNELFDAILDMDEAQFGEIGLYLDCRGMTDKFFTPMDAL